MLVFCILIYLFIAMPVLMLVWAMLVVANRNREARGYDLLKDRVLPFEEITRT
jgi:hypothetical protein